MPAGYLAGRQCKIYLYAGSAYAHLPIAKNPSLSLEWDEAVVEDGASVFKRALKGLCDLGLEIEVNRKIGDTQWKALRDAAIDPDGTVQLAVATGDIDDVGEEVIEAEWAVMSCPMEMPISDTATATISLKPAANGSVPPDIYDVTE